MSQDELSLSKFGAKRAAMKQIVNRYKSLFLSLVVETNLRDTQADRFVTSQSIKRNFYFPYIAESIENRFSRLHAHACIISSNHRRKTENWQIIV